MVRRYATSCAVALTIPTGLGLEPSVADAQQGGRTGGVPPPAAAARAIDYGTAHLDRRLQAVRAAGPITLDGALNEPAWSAAPVANHFLQNDPREGEPATLDTDVRILYAVNALVQYNSDNRQWTSNLRFNIIHRPFSDFFLVYNERRDERTGQMLSRAVIAKMTYLVAF